MLYEFDLVRIHHGLDYLRQMRDILDNMEDKSALSIIPPIIQTVLKPALYTAEVGLVGLNFGRIQLLIDSIRTLLSIGNPLLRQPVYDAVISLENIVKHEMQCAKFYQLPREEIKHLLPDAISNEIRNSFPNCVFDLEEANCCFAYGRRTACVYHCMCVLENVFPDLIAKANALGISYKLPANYQDSWGLMLNKLDAEIKQLLQKPKQVRDSQAYKELAKLSAYMRSLQIAWRDDTMHARGQFTDSIAKSILEQTVNFLNYLAIP